MSKRYADYKQLEKVLKKQVPDRPVFFEYYVDPVKIRPHENYLKENIEDEHERIAERDVRVYASCNMDHATLRVHDYGFTFKKTDIHVAKTISLNEGSMIRSRDDFDKYQWPDLSKVDYDILDRVKKYMPDNIGIMMDAPGGLLENIISLVGYEDLCFMLFEDEDLVKDIVDKIGATLLEHYKIISKYPALKVAMVNDDWGFNTQPMLSPKQMKELIVPWHKKIAEAVHSEGKMIVMHSCGQLESLYDDIIDNIKVDGKHSYEDNITPIEDMYEKYCGRVALMGGIDIDYLCRTSPEEIYKRSRAMLERARDRGGYALGSGNSIPDYIPVESFEAMQKALF